MLTQTEKDELVSRFETVLKAASLYEHATHVGRNTAAEKKRDYDAAVEEFYGYVIEIS